MKRILLLFFAAFTIFSVYSQTYLLDGDRCFNDGDYVCAELKYKEALKFSSGKDKQIAEIKFTRANWCAENIELGNKEFEDKNYKEAILKYQNVLDSNPKDKDAKSQLEKCENILKQPEISLSVLKQNLSFSASGGKETITVNTNATTYNIDGLPSWCFVENQNKNYFVLSCKANSGSIERNGYFTVSAGGKTARINLSQSAATKKQATRLSASKEYIYFTSDGGSERVTVTTNASDYAFSFLPSWCSFNKQRNSFVISCRANKGESRREWFKLIAGGEELKIYVSQRSRENSTSSGQAARIPQKASSSGDFNSPKTNYCWGLSVGYVQKELDKSIIDLNMQGYKIGLRYEPLFKYGFGLNTGIFYENYSFKLFDENNNEKNKYEERFISIPLHLEYRFNFSRSFNLFIYAGITGYTKQNYETRRYFGSDSFESSYDYGLGIRISRIQFNLEHNQMKNKTKNLSVSCSYMF